MRWRVFLLLEAFAVIIVMAASGAASKTSGATSTSTERYPPLPNREAHFPKQPELPLEQQLFLLGDDHVQFIE